MSKDIYFLSFPPRLRSLLLNGENSDAQRIVIESYVDFWIPFQVFSVSSAFILVYLEEKKGEKKS